MFKSRWSERRFATLYDAGTVFWDTHHCFHIGATRVRTPAMTPASFPRLGRDPAPRGRVSGRAERDDLSSTS